MHWCSHKHQKHKKEVGYWSTNRRTNQEGDTACSCSTVKRIFLWLVWVVAQLCGFTGCWDIAFSIKFFTSKRFFCYLMASHDFAGNCAFPGFRRQFFGPRGVFRCTKKPSRAMFAALFLNPISKSGVYILLSSTSYGSSIVTLIIHYL